MIGIETNPLLDMTAVGWFLVMGFDNAPANPCASWTFDGYGAL
jgi:hypothetical protein